MVKSLEYLSTWVDGTVMLTEEIRLFEMVKRSMVPDGEDPFKKLKTLVIAPNGSYTLYAIGKRIWPIKFGLPPTVTPDTIGDLDTQLSQLAICKGNSDETMKKAILKRVGVSKYRNVAKSYVDYTIVGGLETDHSYPTNGTVRHPKCSILVKKGKDRCRLCQSNRNNLLIITTTGRTSECQVSFLAVAVGLNLNNECFTLE